MKVIDKGGFISDIFGVYWYEDTTLFLELSRQSGGLVAISPHDVGMIDPIMNVRTVFFKNRMSSILHWALIEERLLDGVIDHDPEGYNRFLKIVESEGLIDPELDQKIYNEYFPLY